MVAQAQFSVAELSVRPGDTATLALNVYNLGGQTETYTLLPTGLLAGWVRIEPPTVTLFSGSNEVIHVTVRPPAMSTTSAGPAPLAVRVVSQTHPDETVTAETVLKVEAFHDRRVHLLQPVRRGRRRATFEFLVENHGNAQASTRLQLIDMTKRLDGQFNPPAVGVEPGESSLVRLRLKAVNRQWRRGSRTLPFAIEASQQGFASAEASATLVQTPVVPEGLGRKLVATAAIGGLAAGGWFALLKPAAERAAKSAVKTAPASRSTTPLTAQTVGGATTVPSTVGGVGAPTTTVAPPTKVAPEGERFTKQFTAPAKPGAEASSDVFEVPAGQVLEVTDVIFQNPNFDSGRAKLLRGTSELLPWSLDNSTGIEQLVLRTPLQFKAGENIIFEVTCTGAGLAAAGTCTTSALLIGQLKPA